MSNLKAVKILLAHIGDPAWGRYLLPDGFRTMLAATKTDGGKELSASDYAYVGDPEKPSTWKLRIDDEAHVEDALARFNQTDLPSGAKTKVIRKLMAMCRKYGIDATGFKKEYAPKKTSQAMGFTSQQSLEDIRDEINDALAEKFGKASTYPGPKYWLVETFPTYVIVNGNDDPDDMYQIPYSVGEDGLSFGDPQAVDVAYIPVESTGGFSAMAADGGDDWVYPVVMMKAGFANGSVEHAGKKLRQYFDENIIQQVALAANGGKFGRRHPRAGENENAMPERIAGWLDNGRVIDSGDGAMAVADVHLLKSETHLQSTLLAARQANKLDLFGVSVLAYFGYTPAVIAGEPVLKATKLAKFSSLDWCAEPAAGGRFLESIRTAAARELPAEVSEMQREAVKPPVNDGHNHGGAGDGADQNAGGNMKFKEKILTLLAALRKKDAGRATTLETEFTALAEDKHGEFLTKLAEEVIMALPAPAAVVTDENNPVVQARTALAEAKKIQAQTLIQTKLAESKLIGPALEYLKTSFATRLSDGLTVTEDWLKTEIERARSTFAAFSNVGRVRGGGVVVSLDSVDKVQLAVDGLFGLTNDKGVVPFRGIRAAYIHCTGDDALRFDQGSFFRSAQADSGITMGDFPNLLLNSMTKRLLADYAEVGMGGLENLITTGSPIPDYKTQDRVREGYLGDLDTVAESAPYTEIDKPTDERVSYAVAKRGNLLTISEETIRTDDLGAVARFPGRIARAARRTLKQYVTNFFANNPNYGVDTVSWFNEAHNNLGSVALGIDELIAREIALMRQTEKDSGKPLGFPLTWLMVPPELKAVAFQINKAEFYNPSPDEYLRVPNPFYQTFGANNERIVINELLLDENDWYWGTNRDNAPFLEIGYLDGYQQPQILLASLPTQGTLFTNDNIQYKVKFVFGGTMIDYRSVGKNVVSGGTPSSSSSGGSSSSSGGSSSSSSH
jgi:hypothetical protein